MTHLHTKSNVPMSIRNYDRHGMANLAHDKVKPLDRLHIPPWVIYGVIFSVVAYTTMKVNMDKGLNIEQLRRENMLKAMRANREQIIYDTKKEITPAEQFQMKSKQYQTVVKQRSKAEKDTLKTIK